MTIWRRLPGAGRPPPVGRRVMFFVSGEDWRRAVLRLRPCCGLLQVRLTEALMNAITRPNAYVANHGLA